MNKGEIRKVRDKCPTINHLDPSIGFGVNLTLEPTAIPVSLLCTNLPLSSLCSLNSKETQSHSNYYTVSVSNVGIYPKDSGPVFIKNEICVFTMYFTFKREKTLS